jgi:hypothetical protein
MMKFKKAKKIAKKMGFTGFAVLGSFIASAVLLYSAKNFLDQSGRNPSSENPLELQINKISLAQGSKINSFNNAILRVSFSDKSGEFIEYFREKPLNIKQNQSEILDITLDLSKKYIQNDKTLFKIEIVELGLVEQVVLRCQTAAFDLASYNRSFTCSHPQETSPVLSYRIGTKGSTAPAKNAVARLDQ